MWNRLSAFITIFQGMIALIKWFLSVLKGEKKTYRDIFREIEFFRLKRKFSRLNRDDYNYKYIKGAKLIFLLKDYFSRDVAKSFISICKQYGYITFENNFDVESKIIIRNEDKFIEKIINSRKP